MRNIIGFHTSAAQHEPGTTDDVAAVSAVIKVLVESSNAASLAEWHRRAPQAIIMARLISVDQEQQPGGLHDRFRSGHDPVDTAYWYADLIAGIAIPLRLHYVVWESGPNELNEEAGSWWPIYCRAFLERMLKHGLRAAVGGISMGRPQTPPFDTIDEWLNWLDVFQDIHTANLGQPESRAFFYLHEYAANDNMLQSQTHLIRRHVHVYNRHILPRGWFVPLLISELMYAPSFKACHLNAEQIVEQFRQIAPLYASEPYLVGLTLYRILNADDADNIRAVVAPICNMVRQQKWLTVEHPRPPQSAPAPQPEPPPAPPPETGERFVTGTDRLNVRRGPGKNYAILDRLKSGDSVHLTGKHQGAWVEIEWRAWVSSDYLSE